MVEKKAFNQNLANNFSNNWFKVKNEYINIFAIKLKKKKKKKLIKNGCQYKVL